MGERIVSWARGWNATMFAKQGCEGKRLSARIVGASFGPSVFSVGKHSSASCWETDTSSGSVAGSLRFAVHSSFSSGMVPPLYERAPRVFGPKRVQPIGG